MVHELHEDWRKTLFLVLLLKLNPLGSYSRRKLILAKTDPSKVVNVSDLLKNHNILLKSNSANF